MYLVTSLQQYHLDRESGLLPDYAQGTVEQAFRTALMNGARWAFFCKDLADFAESRQKGTFNWGIEMVLQEPNDPFASVILRGKGYGDLAGAVAFVPGDRQAMWEYMHEAAR